MHFFVQKKTIFATARELAAMEFHGLKSLSEYIYAVLGRSLLNGFGFLVIHNSFIFQILLLRHNKYFVNPC